jgi:oxygen-independent coproporphyrinogen-3 oxidase
MCNLSADVHALAQELGFSPALLDPEMAAARALADEGLCEVRGWEIAVPEEARAGVRIVAAAFDAYLNSAQGRHVVAV